MLKKTKNLAIFTTIAAGIGYVTGILTAPKSGKETREDIKVVAVKNKKELEDRLKTLHDEASKLIAGGEATLKSLGEKASSELKAAVSTAQNAKDKAKAVLSALHEGEADDKDLNKAVTELNKAIENLKKYAKKPSA